MKATCQKDPTHNRFLTTAHVIEEWVVDEKGDYVEQTQVLETTHPPDPDNLWTCAICKSVVRVER